MAHCKSFRVIADNGTGETVIDAGFPALDVAEAIRCTRAWYALHGKWQVVAPELAQCNYLGVEYTIQPN